MGRIVWLASYPKSGNTWMRAFLQLAMDNVGYEGGREISPEQNDRLGAILRTVPA